MGSKGRYREGLKEIYGLFQPEKRGELGSADHSSPALWIYQAF